MCCVNAESFRGHVYHGIIKEDAVEGDNVDLDSPLYVRNRNGLARGKYRLAVPEIYCVIYLWNGRYIGLDVCPSGLATNGSTVS